MEEYKKKISITYDFVSEDLNIDSDASAYQLALKLLKESGKEYKLIRFFHTKGVTKNREYIKKELFTSFLNKRYQISKKFENNNSI